MLYAFPQRSSLPGHRASTLVSKYASYVHEQRIERFLSAIGANAIKQIHITGGHKLHLYAPRGHYFIPHKTTSFAFQNSTYPQDNDGQQFPKNPQADAMGGAAAPRS